MGSGLSESAKSYFGLSSRQFCQFMIPFLFGAGWGVAQVLFGLAVIRAGMALSFAITVGLSAGLGSLVPILLRHPEALVTGRGLVSCWDKC